MEKLAIDHKCFYQKEKKFYNSIVWTTSMLIGQHELKSIYLRDSINLQGIHNIKIFK